MRDLLQTVIPVVLTALIAGQVAITRTGRLRADIRTSVDLLDKLPAGHPSRATLEANIGELVDTLVRRQHRRFEPITRAGVWFGANITAACFLLGGMGSLALEEIGVWHAASEQPPPREKWTFIGFYTAVGLCFAFFAFGAWRRGKREHPAQPQPTQDGPITVGIGRWVGAHTIFAVIGLVGTTLMAMDPLPRSVRETGLVAFAALMLAAVGSAVAGFVRWWRDPDLDDDQATAPA